MNFVFILKTNFNVDIFFEAFTENKIVLWFTYIALSPFEDSQIKILKWL